MKVILSHPTGNANVRETAKALAERNMLTAFYTAVASFPGSLVDQIGTIKTFSEIHRRRFDPILKPYTKMYPWIEVGRLTAAKIGLKQLTRHTNGIFSIDAVYQSLDKHVASKITADSHSELKAIYAYEDGAYYTFNKAKQARLHCIYDLPTGYWRAARKLLANEQERWPEWMSTMTGFQDSDEKLLAKDVELGLADLVFVASTFTANTLKDYPGQLPPVKVIPYGFPSVDFAAAKRTHGGNRLKLLFVGKLTQQKGLADLFAVAETLKNHVSLTVVGHKAVENCQPLNDELSKHRWIPTLPHGDILKIMREHDILVFPSLFDGFGLVISEAMSQGIPVLASNRSAGPDLIKDGENGWLFKAGSAPSLMAVFEGILLNRQSIKSIAHAALETANARPWRVYRQELSTAINNTLAPIDLL